MTLVVAVDRLMCWILTFQPGAHLLFGANGSGSASRFGIAWRLARRFAENGESFAGVAGRFVLSADAFLALLTNFAL